MKGSLFRSPETWKSAFLTLPDSSYFELMRSIFGNIKTPFNKQRLVEDLASFLSRKEIQETIAAYIDHRDAKIIAAIAALDEPVPGDLETFFTGEFTYAELHSILINLEERLILYRFQEKGLYHLSLNPLLEPVLGPVIANKTSLFPTAPLGGESDDGFSETKAAPSAPALPILNDRILAALFAFISEERDFFKSEGGIRKKVLDDGKILFPNMELETIIGGLQCLGLLRQEGEGLVADTLKLHYFTDLSFYERMEYCAAGICLDINTDKSILGRFNRSRIYALTRFIHTFMSVLKAGRQYPQSTLKRIADILERSGIEQLNPWGAEISGLRGVVPGTSGAPSILGFQGRPGVLSIGFDSILRALKAVGLLGLDDSGGNTECWYPLVEPSASGLNRIADPGVEKAAIAMDTAFSCILYPEIRFNDALALASFSLVRETGTAVRFEFTRESVVRSFDRGMNAETIAALLNRLSGSQVDQNLCWTLKDWETRYSGVSLFQGIVLTLSEDRQYLAEAEPVASMIARILTPGVYLLSAPDKADAIQALHRAGIDIIAQPPWIKEDSPGERSSPYPSLTAAPRFYRYSFQDNPAENLFPKLEDESPVPDTESAEYYKNRFRTALGKIPLSKAERDELSARIERRLILSESQLVGVSVRYEKLEARGLDYVGKTSIAKQAIAAKLHIEIMWADQDGEVNRVIGIPEALEKSEGETILVLTPIPTGDIIRLPLGKISLLRRIKQSIFGE
jgi:hypothetical protein